MFFKFVFPSTFETVFLCNISVDNLNSNDKKCLYILLAATKKAPRRGWLKPEPPTTEDWKKCCTRDLYKGKTVFLSYFTEYGLSGRNMLSLLGLIFYEPCHSICW